MKITTVRFDKKFSYAPYLNYDLGLDAELEEGETEQDAWAALEEKCNQYHQQKHSQLIEYQETPPLYNAKEDFPPVPLPEPEEKITPETGRKHTILEIQKCTTEKELNNWKLIAYLHPETKEAFDNRLKELSDKVV